MNSSRHQRALQLREPAAQVPIGMQPLTDDPAHPPRAPGAPQAELPGRLCRGQIAVRLHQPEGHLPSFLAPAPAPREERGRRDRGRARDPLEDCGHGRAREPQERGLRCAEDAVVVGGPEAIGGDLDPQNAWASARVARKASRSAGGPKIGWPARPRFMTW